MKPRKKEIAPQTAYATEYNAARRRRAERLTDKLSTLAAALLITLLLLVFALLTWCVKDAAYSENENRYLAQKPALSASSVADGTYMKDMESYLSDQFFARGAFMKARTRADIFMGKREMNDVYIGKEHFLFEKPAALDKARVDKTLAAVNAFNAAHKNMRSYVAIAPNASEILADLLPENAPTQSQKKQLDYLYQNIKGAQCIDLLTPLSKYKEPAKLYYRTDHHWTAYGANTAFRTLAKEMELNTDKVKYRSYAVSHDFRGTMASSSGLFHTKDNLFITVPQTDTKYLVTYTEEDKKSTSLFVSEKLQQKNQYEVFFGGNFAEVHIDTDNDSEQVLLVMKDSYANSVVPLLVPYYKSIVMVDARYFRGKLENVIEKEGVTDILWLYNVNTFLLDTSIVNVV